MVAAILITCAVLIPFCMFISFCKNENDKINEHYDGEIE